MMLIEVKETHPPKAGGKVAHVIAADGAKFEIWPDKLPAIRVGMRYEVDVKEREYNGRTLRSITKAAPAGTAPAAGYAREAPTAPPPAPPAGEAEYVGRILSALILKGEMTNNQIAAYTARLRQIWRDTDPAAQSYSEAAE